MLYSLFIRNMVICIRRYASVPAQARGKGRIPLRDPPFIHKETRSKDFSKNMKKWNRDQSAVNRRKARRIVKCD